MIFFISNSFSRFLLFVVFGLFGLTSTVVAGWSADEAIESHTEFVATKLNTYFNHSSVDHKEARRRLILRYLDRELTDLEQSCQWYVVKR